jgi:hypothetical protein
MAKKFDHRSLAQSIGKLLAAAETNIERPGASIATQRLIDYSSGEFGKLTPKQSLKVLGALDKKFKKNLLKDGDGKVIGYVYSGRIFVSLKDSQQEEKVKAEKKSKKDPKKAAEDPQEDYAKKYAAQYIQQEPAKKTDDKKKKPAGKKSASKKK